MDGPVDIVILGGGPAGLSAALYAGRSRLETVLIEKGITGGQAFTTDFIENYPGFNEGVSGPDLTDHMRVQAENFGATIKTGYDIEAVEVADGSFTVRCQQETIEARAVIVATGADSRRLDIPGEAEFTGRGVSYCATCDGAFFKDKVIAVIGGGNTAVEEALYLTKFAGKIYLIHRREELRATKIVQERALAHDKIEMIWNSIPLEVGGEGVVKSLKIKNVKTNEVSSLSLDGVFVYIGYNPSTAFLPAGVELDDLGYIMTDERLETSIKGIFAAGDVRSNQLKQVVVAAAEGAIAAVSAEKYLERVSHER